MRPLFFAVASLAIMAVARVGAKPSPAPSATSAIAPPPHARFHREKLTPLAGSILAQQMQNHGDQMTDLMWAVIFLEHDVVKDDALAIVRQPVIARPLPATPADDLSRQLPGRFFVYQAEMQDRALDLANAAADEDDSRIADAWARLSRACVQCHTAYLTDED